MSHRLMLVVVAALALAAALFSSATRHSTTSHTGPTDAPAQTQAIPSSPTDRKQEKILLTSQESNASFAEIAQKALDSLPRVEDFRASGADYHQTPKVLLDSSEALTQVSLALREHPEYAAQGIEFYRACSRNESLMTAVRAVCLQRLTYWTKGSVADYHTPSPELWDLAQGLPALPPQ